ncbi:MAG: class I SAM-dependent DNA methyltransferase [Ferruginibacter sp.]
MDVMDKYTETFNTWNSIAQQYQDKFMQLSLYNETYDYFIDTLHSNTATVLEIGCGPGMITHYLLLKKPSFNIHGIDIAPNMIALAKSNNPTASFEVMDGRHIHQIKSTYDGIIGGFCVPYLSPEDVIQLLANAYSLLNNEGILYLSFVEGEHSQSGFQVGSTGNRCYFYYHSLATIEAALIDHQFQLLKTFKVEYQSNETVSEMHTILIAQKMKPL